MNTKDKKDNRTSMDVSKISKQIAKGNIRPGNGTQSVRVSPKNSPSDVITFIKMMAIDTTIQDGSNFITEEVNEKLRTVGLSFYDKCVLDACNALYYDKGKKEFRVQDIGRELYGSTKSVRPGELEHIQRSVEILRRIELSIDWTEEIKANYIITDETFSFKASHSLLPVKPLRSTFRGNEFDGYYFESEPILYIYSRAKNQIAHFDTKLLEIGGKLQVETMLIKRYLIERIEKIKNPKSKTNCTITFEYEDRHYCDNTASVHRKTKGMLADIGMYSEDYKQWYIPKGRVIRNTLVILDSYVSIGYIRKYTINTMFGSFPNTSTEKRFFIDNTEGLTNNEKMCVLRRKCKAANIQSVTITV